MAREADVVRSLVAMAVADAAIDGTLDRQAWAPRASRPLARPPDGPASGEG